MKKIVFDIETTGFENEDKIVEIGAIELDKDNQPTGMIFHTYINPEIGISKEMAKIHGLTTDFLKKYPTFKKIQKKFLQFIKGKELIAHNLPFELYFINRELELSLQNKTTDTLVLAKKSFPKSKCSLDELCNRYKINLSSLVYRGTLLNAYCLAEIYRRLVSDQRTANVKPIKKLK